MPPLSASSASRKSAGTSRDGAPAASAAVLTAESRTSAPAAAPNPKMKPARAAMETNASVTTPSGAAIGPAALGIRKPIEPAKKIAKTAVPPAIPEPMHNGEQSLTRALGLKIGRIVIDAGHGGHDTGTIGPSGLMEKDLCLDIALRVGQLVQQRLPAAEIVYTREDDTFVPLEQRTSMANSAKADLFVSIHANSSEDRSAGGIETYYLNFNASPEAMAVAARENTTAQSSVHDLEDLVNKIAKNEKIEESHDLATDIQTSLSKRMQTARHAGKNRGVRKAPFVVLIGAKMPSALAEISFLSNPADEQWLKKGDNRQRVAEGLYQGIENYLQSTNSFASNQGRLPRPWAAVPSAVSSDAAPARAAAGSTPAPILPLPPAPRPLASANHATSARSASVPDSAVARSSDAQ